MRTFSFVLIGLILGAALGTIGAYFDNSGAASQKTASMIFCGVVGALLLGFGFWHCQSGQQPGRKAHLPETET